MKICYSLPEAQPDQKNQTELSDINDEDFKNLFVPKQANSLIKAIRLFFFIITLGPIRLLLTIVLTLFYFVFVNILLLTKPFFSTAEAFRTFVHRTANPIIRIVLFIIGIGKIKVNGSQDPKARTIITNHLSLIDGMIFFYVKPLCFVVMASLKSVSLFRKFGECFGFIFVDRSKKNGGVTDQIREAQNNSDIPPVQIFPEGKITNGECLLGFRSGGFVNDTPIQPATIRYHQYLSPPELATVAWIEDDFKAYIYHLFSIPLITVEITYLDTIDFSSTGKTPQEKARDVELAMANSLGVKAISRNNKEIFQKPKEE